MKIAIPKEIEAGEPRVAASPETVKRMKAHGADLVVETGAGLRSGMADEDYTATGASIAGSAGEAVRDADIVLKVRRPTEGELTGYRPGALVIAIMDPFGNDQALAAMARAGV